MLHEEITEKIIQAFFKINKALGYGFLEKVYENALAIELRKMDLKVRQQEKIVVRYEGEIVGNYEADLIVEDLIIVEIKAQKALAEEHEAQLINYLRSTDKEVGLLLNFGRKAEFKRKIYTKDNK